MKIIWIETKYKNDPINPENFVYLLTISLGLLKTHNTLITFGKTQISETKLGGWLYLPDPSHTTDHITVTSS